MRMASQSHHIEAEDSDSEWEYEYHDTETETFYVTLDLSAGTQDAFSRFRRPHAGRKDKHTQPPGDEHHRSKSATVSASAAPRMDESAPPPASATPDPPAGTKVQILDLPSRNPLVSYDGQLYSCTWGTTIGTDLTLARPDVELPFEPLHREPGFQIATKSSIRLVGTPAKLIPKTQTKPPLPAAAAAPPYDSHLASPFTAPPPPHITIPLHTTASDDRRNQAAFLERVAAAKRARGDADEVFIARNKSYADYLPQPRRQWMPNLSQTPAPHPATPPPTKPPAATPTQYSTYTTPAAWSPASLAVTPHQTYPSSALSPPTPSRSRGRGQGRGRGRGRARGSRRAGLGRESSTDRTPALPVASTSHGAGSPMQEEAPTQPTAPMQDFAPNTPHSHHAPGIDDGRATPPPPRSEPRPGTGQDDLFSPDGDARVPVTPTPVRRVGGSEGAERGEDAEEGAE